MDKDKLDPSASWEQLLAIPTKQAPPAALDDDNSADTVAQGENKNGRRAGKTVHGHVDLGQTDGNPVLWSCAASGALVAHHPLNRPTSAEISHSYRMSRHS